MVVLFFISNFAEKNHKNTQIKPYCFLFLILQKRIIKTLK